MNEPYYPNLLEKFMCWLGFHSMRESTRFYQTYECYKCGKRVIKGVNQ